MTATKHPPAAYQPVSPLARKLVSTQVTLSAKKPAKSLPTLPLPTREKCPIIQGKEGTAAAEWVRIDKLRLWEDNPRDNDGKPVQEVAKSIAEDGQFGATIVARKADNLVLAGHTRIKAALSLGMDLVPVRYLDLPLRKAKKHALKDNKTAELAQWNDPKLAAVIAELRREEPDLEIPGFDPAEIDRLVREALGEGLGADEAGLADALDHAAELQAKWHTEAGQLWEIPSATWPGKTHRLLCGNSTSMGDVTRLMHGAVAVWMWTDPPYGVEYVGKTKSALTIANDGPSGLQDLLSAAFQSADAILADSSPIYIAHPAGALSITFGQAFVNVGWHLHQTLAWIKNAMVLGHSDYHYQHEPILYGWKGSNRIWHGGRDKVSVLEFPKPSCSDMHPTTKPVGLVAHCLGNSSDRGSIGYEPFSGSGTTLVAAEQLGRIGYGMELSPKYVAVALERLSGLGLTPRLTQ